MADYQLSPQQLAVLDWVKNGKGSLNLIAYAGTGKTSTLMEVAKVITGKAFMGAFNKAIAEEFKQRLAAQGSYHVTGATIHSAGMKAWTKVNPRVQVESSKVKGIARNMLTGRAWDKKLIGTIAEVVSYGKQACLGVGGTAYNAPQPWQDIIDYYDVQENISGLSIEAFIEHCIKVYGRSLELCEEEIDFDDMLLAPLYYKAPFQKYDWVLIDEAQDTNTARRLIAFEMMRPNSRLIAVGDPFQAIYGFAGADSNSMGLIKAHLNSEELPLSVTYRCPKAVVAVVQQWVPDFTAAPSAANGLVTTLEHTDLWSQGFSWNDAILCRNTRPLVGIAQRLRKNGIQCTVEGMSAKGLIALAEKWDDIDIKSFRECLVKYEAVEVAKWELKGKAEKVGAIQDRCATLADIASELDEDQTTRDLVKRIEWLFADNGAQCLRLCTIHRSKGREWNRVYLIGRNRYMPSQWAQKDWELQQEDNLAYVAVTRAKVELVEVNVPWKQKGDSSEWWER